MSGADDSDPVVLDSSQDGPSGAYKRANLRVVRFAESSKVGERVPFLWGLIEATFFVIVPDIAIGYAAAYGWKRGLRAVGYAVIGATVGGILVFVMPLWWQSVFLHLPGVHPAMLDRVASSLEDHGWWAVIAAPTAGLPYKLYAAEAAIQGRSLLALVAVTPVARGWRFLLAAAVGIGVGQLLRRPLEKHAMPVLVVYLLLWVGFYISYFRAMESEYGG